MPGMEGIIAAVVIAVLLFSLLLVLLTRYKKCPSDKIMVIYGQVGRNKDGSSKSSICIHGGAAFVWPLVQAYQFLDLTPMSLQVDLVNALSRQNIRVDVPSRFTVGISTEQGLSLIHIYAWTRRTSGIFPALPRKPPFRRRRRNNKQGCGDPTRRCV